MFRPRPVKRVGCFISLLAPDWCQTAPQPAIGVLNRDRDRVPKRRVRHNNKIAGTQMATNVKKQQYVQVGIDILCTSLTAELYYDMGVYTSENILSAPSFCLFHKSLEAFSSFSCITGENYPHSSTYLMVCPAGSQEQERSQRIDRLPSFRSTSVFSL